MRGDFRTHAKRGHPEFLLESTDVVGLEKVPSKLAAFAMSLISSSLLILHVGCWTAAAQKVVPGVGSEQMEQANVLLREGNFESAMDGFETVLRVSPASEEAQAGEVQSAETWALQSLKGGKGEEAVAILERALRLLPKQPELLVDLGIEATRLQEFPVAQQALSAANALRPDDPRTIYAMADLAIAAGHLEDAERNLQLYLSLKGNDASAWFALGHVYLGQQRVEQASKALHQSLQLQPRQTESYIDLGQMALDAHEDERATTLFQKVLARAPRHAGALTGLGQLALRSKQYAKAEELLSQAEKSDPAYKTPHYYRGVALSRLGRSEEAKQEFLQGDGRPHATSSGTEP